MSLQAILGGTAEGPQPLGWLLSHYAALDPDRAAITFEDRTITRGELDRAANRMARALAEKRVGQDDFVALVLPNDPLYHVYAFALWKLGATPAPLPFKLPPHELQAVLELINPKLVIGPDVPAIGAFPCLHWRFEPDSSLSDEPHPPRIARHMKAITSGGSTGRPKVIVDAAPSVHDPRQIYPPLQIIAEDTVLHPAPMYHNAPFAQTNWTLATGGHVIEMASFDPLKWLELVERHKVRWAYLVPTMMNRIWNVPEADRGRFDLSSLKVAMHMAAPCPEWLKEAWIDWLGPERIWEIFGATEAVGGSLINGVEWLSHRGSVGVPNRELRILDETGKEVPIGEIGELFFKVREGAEKTFDYRGGQRRVVDGWETLGDMGRLDDEGYLYLADRRTDMIISGGANIYPAEIESALEAHPAVASSAVVGLPDADFGRRPHAIIEIKAGVAEPSAAELETFIGARLVRYKLPATYEISPTPLRDDAGKVRRSALRDEREAQMKAGKAFTPLRTSQKP